jgi:hypothetical protein
MTGQLIPALLTVGLGFGFLATQVWAAAPEWGTVKGQVVFGGAAIPEPKPVDVNNNQDKQHCLSQGSLLSDEWVVNKENKGVRWAFVWLAPATSSEPLRVHPSLKEIPKKEVEIDQPCCKFIPHALGLRQGQELLAKNSAPVAHNINWTGLKNPGGNQLLPAGKSFTITNLVADRFPVKLACNIHPWMSAWIRVFDHPYFAVTDENGKFEIKLAPAGNYRLVSWQEVVGFGPGGRLGVPVTLRGGADTDVGKLELKPPDNK